jgi:hypothetical protein
VTALSHDLAAGAPQWEPFRRDEDQRGTGMAQNPSTHCAAGSQQFAADAHCSPSCEQMGMLLAQMDPPPSAVAWQ